jgi:hypothetical protein
VTPFEIAFGALQGLLMSTGFVLFLFIGFVFVFGFTKFRSHRDSLIVRNLYDEQKRGFGYLAPDAPRGPADQLRTPELLEQAGRKD